jgi:KaiC/GvpD/RAD55 family RecA-like ATPase
MIGTTAYDRVTARLAEVTGYQARNGRDNWRCPAHPDKTPSLSVDPADDRVLVVCRAGCDIHAVLAALDLTPADLFDEPPQRTTNGHDVSYRYVDEGNRLLFEVVRKPGKKFLQRVPDGNGGWSYRLGTTRRVLYRLPRLLEAVRAGTPIFVCEGEKDVHAVESSGGVATTNPGGAGKWRPEYSDTLTGADVIVVADQDGPGLKHAAMVEASLIGKAKRVRVVNPLAGKDASDHLTGGHTLDDWLQAGKPSQLERFPLGPLLRAGVPAPMMVHEWLYSGGLHTIQSEPGVGKTWLALWLSTQLIGAGSSVLYLDEEGGEELAAERLIALGADPELVDRLFFYYPFPERTWSDDDLAALADAIDQASKAGPVAMGVFDSLPDFLASAGQSEDSSMDVTSFVRRILTPFREVSAALVVLDHLKKPDESGGSKKRTKYARGSGAKLAKAHLTMLLDEAEPFSRERSGRLHLWATKDRRGHVPLPRLKDNPLVLSVQVDAGSVRIDVSPDAVHEGWQGPTKCMDAVFTFLSGRPGEKFSLSRLTEEMKNAGLSYKKETKLQAIHSLMDDSLIRSERKGQATLVWVDDQGVMQEQF